MAGGSDAGRAWWRVLLVFIGCFAAASLVSRANFPHVAGAVLFPSYAVLTAALLVETPRRFWLVMLASAAGNFVPHLWTGPPTFVLLTEVANFTRALIVVLAVRRFAGTSAPLGTLRSTTVFLIAAVGVAPAVAAVVGAAIVVAFRGQAFWEVFRAWFSSNALTAITLLAPLWIFAAAPALPRPRKVGEAATLALGLSASSAAAFVFLQPDSGLLPSAVCWPVPFLIWAAVRFGPVGVGASLLGVAALALQGATRGHGPFLGGTPGENLLHLQLFLLVTAIPLLLLATLVEQLGRTAAALSVSQAQYQSVVEDQTEMICRFRPSGAYTFVNEAFSRHTGASRDDGLAGNGLELFPRAALTDIGPARPCINVETERTVDGQSTSQAWICRGIFDDGGALLEYQCVGRDVTAAKLAEQQRNELSAQRQIADVLREDKQQKDEFLAMLGHELRNPLAPISAALLLLESPDAEPRAEARQVISRQLRNMGRLVEDLVDVSRITRGDIRLRFAPLELDALAAQAVEAVRPLVDARRHQLDVTLPDRQVTVLGDAARLTQVLVNLLNNAVKYTEPGGRIRLTIKIDGDVVVFSVQDNGLGIPSDMHERVFERFERGSVGPLHAIDGLGVGLTLARRLVALHGGTVTAHSTGPGSGSEFVVRLPLEVIEAEEPEDEPPPALAGAERREVLVVDDNDDAASALARLLELRGHSVRTAHNGTQAISSVRAHPPEVVVSDLGLPDFTGFELARRLREDASTAGAMLIAVTGLDAPADRVRSSEAGFDHHLVKPVDFAVLERLIASR